MLISLSSFRVRLWWRIFVDVLPFVAKNYLGLIQNGYLGGYISKWLFSPPPGHKDGVPSSLQRDDTPGGKTHKTVGASQCTEPLGVFNAHFSLRSPLRGLLKLAFECSCQYWLWHLLLQVSSSESLYSTASPLFRAFHYPWPQLSEEPLKSNCFSVLSLFLVESVTVMTCKLLTHFTRNWETVQLCNDCSRYYITLYCILYCMYYITLHITLYYLYVYNLLKFTGIVILQNWVKLNSLYVLYTPPFIIVLNISSV